MHDHPTIPEAKVCRCCGENLPLDSFHRDAMRPDGRRARCRGCVAQYAYAHRKTIPPEHAREVRRRQYERDPGKYLERERRHRMNNPEKDRARNIINKAIQRGAVVRPEVCEWCGIGGSTQASHGDYSKPYDVIWLCPQCHRNRDCGGSS